jgi:hypothetical protein
MTAGNGFQLVPCPVWVKSRHISAKGNVRFAPNSDRESGFPQTLMSALPPKADMCGATSLCRADAVLNPYQVELSNRRF